MRSIKVKLKLSPEQKKTIKGWMHTSRYIYNKAVCLINEGIKPNFMEIRNKIVTAKNNPDIKEWELDTPKDIRAGAVKSAVTAFKSCTSNLKNGNIEKFKLRGKSKRQIRHCIDIPKTAIKINKDGRIKIFSRYIKSDIHPKQKIKEIEHDSKLIWSYPSEFHLVLPYMKKRTENKPKKETVALDPGIRKFLSGYSREEIFTCNYKGISGLKEKLDSLNSEKSKRKKRKTRIRKAILRTQAKIRNKVTQFHYEVIFYLSRYKNILLPSFESQEFFGERRVIGKISARDLMINSHYKFKQRLIDSLSLKNNNVFIVNESYTSKTCGRCGILNDVGSSEIYKCNKCKCKIDRDVNGARNVMIKHLNRI